MKRFTIVVIAAFGAVAVLNPLVSVSPESSSAAPLNAASHEPAVLAAGPGRVESLSEEIHVGARIAGALRELLVAEGDHVRKADLLAVIDNDVQAAQVRSAEAEVRVREAELQRIVNGARTEERREGAAALAEADAILASALLERDRGRRLIQDGIISRREADGLEREADVAEARVDAARERYNLLEAAAREEDVVGAEATTALARARLDEARANYDLTFVRAPIAGVILRSHRRAGEAVSTEFESPVVTMADTSARRVRVEIDEADINQVAVGQPAYVTADAFAGVRFRGHVTQVSALVGRKTIRTDEPAERVDTKVLEVLVDLDDGHELPLGLRVQAFIVGTRGGE